MASDEHARFELHRRLQEVLGPERAATLMAYLPTAEVATRHDLVVLEERTSAGFSQLRAEMAELRSEMHTGMAALRTEIAAQTRVFVVVMVGAVATVGGLAVAAAGLG